MSILSRLGLQQPATPPPAATAASLAAEERRAALEKRRQKWIVLEVRKLVAGLISKGWPKEVLTSFESDPGRFVFLLASWGCMPKGLAVDEGKHRATKPRAQAFTLAANGLAVQLRARQHEVAQAELDIDTGVDEALVQAFVAAADQHRAGAGRPVAGHGAQAVRR